MNSKVIGGTLLVVGTTIGAGMLALPVATAQLGFTGSLIMLISCWAVMTACAFLFLEVNLWLPANTNYISMAGATLGRVGQAVAWVFYLLLLYSILSAYIAGGGDLLHYVFTSRGIPMPLWGASTLFAMILGVVVYLGIRMVDYVNRGLMFGKLGAFVLLTLLLFPFVSSKNLEGGELHYILAPTGIMVTALAFTCLMIVPSLRTYFGDDIKSLRKTIFIGTLIPLVCYIAWDFAIMGVVPLDGGLGLKNMLHSSNSNSDLVAALAMLLHSNKVNMLAKFFTSICMATSFLSVSLSLSDFLSDGFNIAKKGLGSIVIFILTFGPPLGLVLFYPNMFIRGLQYAGLSAFILMILYPPLMVWFGRYHRSIAQGDYQVRGGKILLAVLVLFATLMIGFGIEGAV